MRITTERARATRSTTEDTMRRIGTWSAILGLALMTPSGALGLDGGEPSDASLLEARTVGVLPVLSAGPSRDGAYLRMAAAVEQGAEASRPGLRAGELASLDVDAGFAFAGESTEDDVHILRFAFILGGLAAEAHDPHAVRETAHSLAAARGLLAPLSSDAIEALDRVVAAAHEGRVDTRAIVESLRAAEEGIAAGPARAHGYLAAGLWFGLSMLAATLDEVDPGFIAMAGPLAMMLDEDAVFGGSDRRLAAELRAVAGLLGAPQLDAAAQRDALTRAMTVSADAE